MRTVYKDWDCRLLPMTGELITRPEETIRSLLLLKEKFGFKRFLFTPRFDAEFESVTAFLLRRDRSLKELQALLPDGISVSCGAVSVLTAGLAEQLFLRKLCMPKTNYLPIMLPFYGDKQIISLELNRLLYHSPYRVLFYSFDTALYYYSKADIERWINLPNAAYCFRYQSIEQPEIRCILRRLMERNVPILFGTGLNAYEKACYYEFDHYIRVAADHFSEYECDLLFHSNQLYKILR